MVVAKENTDEAVVGCRRQEPHRKLKTGCAVIPSWFPISIFLTAAVNITSRKLMVASLTTPTFQTPVRTLRIHSTTNHRTSAMVRPPELDPLPLPSRCYLRAPVLVHPVFRSVFHHVVLRLQPSSRLLPRPSKRCATPFTVPLVVLHHLITHRLRQSTFIRLCPSHRTHHHRCTMATGSGYLRRVESPPVVYRSVCPTHRQPLPRRFFLRSPVCATTTAPSWRLPPCSTPRPWRLRHRRHRMAASDRRSLQKRLEVEVRTELHRRPLERVRSESAAASPPRCCNNRSSADRSSPEVPTVCTGKLQWLPTTRRHRSVPPRSDYVILLG